MKRELNISTYEEWMVDHLDGVLSADELLRFQQFLTAHPELAEDLDLLEHSVLIADESVILAMKGALKKDPLEDEDIIALIEDEGDLGALSDTEMQLARIYAKTKLEADARITYPGKDALKHSEGRVIPMWFKAVSLAASLLLAFFLIPSSDTPTYVARDGGPLAWETIDLAPAQTEGNSLLTEASENKEWSESAVPESHPELIDELEPLLVQTPTTSEPTIIDNPSRDLELPLEQLTDVPVPINDTPFTDPSIESPGTELAEDIDTPKASYAPVSKHLRDERPYTTALDLLKKATAGSDILAIQDVDPEAAYVQTSLKFGRFEVAVKRKKKN